MFNKDELIVDRVRSATYHDLETGEILLRLTSIEEPTLNCTAEGEEVTDAIGSTVTTLYRAKKAQFTGQNSLFNFGLAAAQYGTKKQLASKDSKFNMPTYEVLTIADGATTVTASHKAADLNAIKYIYLVVGGEIATAYQQGTGEATETTFLAANTNDKLTITVPTGLTGKIFVEYEYETEEAMKIVNKASEFPTSGNLKVYAYFRDKCNDSLVYSGAILAPKAKINAESVETALTSTGKHGFQFDMNKDYCDEEGELFTVIVAQ